jgi:hypothetical protein
MFPRPSFCETILMLAAKRLQLSPAKCAAGRLMANTTGVASMARYYGRTRISFAERFGMVLGGGAVLAVLSAQVIFVAWIAGFVH